MRTRDDDRRQRIAAALVLVALLLGGLPAVRLAGAVTDSFTASLTVTNAAPLVYFVDASQSLTGSAGTSAAVYVFFNATDTNGYTDINVSNASVTITNGSTTLYSTGCVLFSGSGQNARINCTVSLRYYDPAGIWVINASVRDNSTNFAQNFTQTLTVNALDAISLVSSSISFSGAPGASDVAPTPTSQVVNNTGNRNYTSINLTGYAFTSGTNTIHIGNVTANVTASGGLGQILINNTEVLLNSSNLTYGAVATRNIFFYLDIPSGQTSGSYSAQASWVVEANT